MSAWGGVAKDVDTDDLPEAQGQEALLPCPFCKGQARVNHDDCCVECVMCSAMTYCQDDVAPAVEQWNRREYGTPFFEAELAEQEVKRLRADLARAREQLAMAREAMVTIGMKATSGLMKRADWHDALKQIERVVVAALAATEGEQ